MYDVILTCNYSPWSSYRGGGQKSTHMIATALAKTGRKVCVIYSKGLLERVSVPGDLKYDVSWAFFFAIKPGISSPLRFLNGISFYLKVRRLSNSGTALHANGEEASLFGRIRKKGKFIYSHRYPGFENFMHRIRWNSPWIWPYLFLREPRYAAMALALREADGVTCTSLDSKDQLLAYFRIPAAKIRIVPNGIDPVFLETRFEWKGQSGILYFGRLTHAKGVDLLLRAYAGLSETQRNANRLKIIGEGPYETDLKRLASQLGVGANLEWKRWASSEELATEIISHRMVVLPSREESFGNTMLEVLATGQDLITTNAGSIPEVVGDHARRVPSENVEALRDAVQLHLSEIPEADHIAARTQYVREMFSWEKTARTFSELYGSAI